jgi:hypothetical protein
MRAALRDLGRRARRQVRADLRTDPYLPYALALTALLAGFWFWHSVPNFATRDERWRVLEPIEPVGFFLEEPSLSSIRDGVAFWRDYGATFYLYAVLLVPVIGYAVLSGQLDVLPAVSHHDTGALWDHWLRGPAWLWTTAVLVGRVINVGLAVGCVYVTYRLGTLLRDRATGRLAAALLAVTWTLVLLAHEAGEDVPALFCFLVTVYLCLRYVEDGELRIFYAACGVGGLAIAMKITVGVAAVLVFVAHLLRARRAETGVRAAAYRPRLLARGAALGAVVVLAGYPVVLVGDPADLAARLFRGTTSKVAGHGWLTEPSWWWVLRGYLHGLGLPLFFAVGAGVVATLPRLRERSLETDGLVLALSGTGTFLAVFATWGYVRTHHLLPTVPLLVLVLAVALERLGEDRPAASRLVVAMLLVTSAAYAGVGTLAYASQPRDQARAWLADHADETDTVETYVRDPQESAVPHWMAVNRITNRTVTRNGTTRELDYAEWIRAMPQRCPEYVQLTYHASLLYVASANHSDRAGGLTHTTVTRHVERLLAGEYDAYEVAATFGRPPAFLDDRDRPLDAVAAPEPRDPGRSLLYAGLNPRTVQYGDPQDFGVAQYTVVIERTGPCEPEETSESARVENSPDESRQVHIVSR